MYPTKKKESRVCSLAHQVSGSEMIGLKSFFSQPNKLVLSIVSTASRPLSMFSPESCLNIGWEELTMPGSLPTVWLVHGSAQFPSKVITRESALAFRNRGQQDVSLQRNS